MYVPLGCAQNDEFIGMLCYINIHVYHFDEKKYTCSSSIIETTVLAPIADETDTLYLMPVA